MHQTDRRGHQRIKFLTSVELKNLLQCAVLHSMRDYCMILLGYRHGLRASEVCNLDVDDIELGSRCITCGRLKGSISNWQRLEGDEVAALRAWLQARPVSPTRRLFVDGTGTPLSRFQFYRLFRRHARRTGIPPDKCHPHCLKHSLGTHLANAGVPVQIIQQRLGHRCIQNTMVYLAISSPVVDQAVASAIAAGDVV